MGGLFESEEATAPQVRVPLLALARRLVLALFALEAGSGWWPVTDAVDNLARWAAGHGAFGFPIGSTISLALRLLALLAMGGALATLARVVRERPRVGSGAVAVRVDEAGLRAGDRLVVARRDVASVQVATDADMGFALLVTTRSGATLRVPQRSEGSARGLASALASAETGADAAAVVFEGVSGGRTRQTRAAVLAGASVLATLLVVMGLHWMSDSPAAWRWFDGWRAEIPFTFAWWLDLVCELGILPVGIALAAALGPLARRLRTGSVTVGPRGVETSERTLAPGEIAGVEPGAASDVTLALRSGRQVRFAFGAERALVERDLFVARVRELTDAPAGEVTYPAAETSGIRVALRPEQVAAAETVAEDEQADAEEGAQAPRARRR